jgi:ribosomal protein L22
MLRISPQKLNLVAQLIRGKKVEGAGRPRSSRASDRGRREEVLVGDRQRREQP